MTHPPQDMDARPIAPRRRSQAFRGAICPGCGASFTPIRDTQKHCRPSCRRRALDHRRDAADLAAQRALQLENQLTQTTIGANGAAAALTANPVGYLKIKINGTYYIIPVYNP